jgi:two-component system, cell cycle sensor histidine kinase and response regulator CckA
MTMPQLKASTAGVNTKPLRVLLLEDNPVDAELSLRELKKAGFDVSADIVETSEDFAERLRANTYDIVLSDQNLPAWTGMDALEFLQQKNMDIPFILVTGSLGEEAAVECIKKGASDYILKDRVARIPVAVRRALEEKALRDEHERLKLQLSQAQKMEAIGRLAGGIAHDFNNHLGIMIGYSERLLDRLGPDDQLRRSAGMIKDAGMRAATLTRQLLAFSRRQVFEPQILSVNTLVLELEKMLRPMIGEDIELILSLKAANGKVKADPAQVDQVIMNLAINSRDAMPNGGRLTLETADVELDEEYASKHVTVQPGSYVMLAVSDNGAGMDTDTQTHMFEPFFTTKEKGKGTGLGLATVYGIVKQSGGYIWVYSEPGKGTTFKIYLPQEDIGAQQAESIRRSLPIPQGKETVLVVEDEGMLRELACEFLQGCGYKVLEAENGHKALETSRGHNGAIHLLMTDAIMPGMGGRELAQRMHDDRRDIRVLYVSGYTDDSVLRDGLLEPGTAFLQKPFTRESLTRKVREILDRRLESLTKS